MTWLALRGTDGTARRLTSRPMPGVVRRGTLTLELDLSVYAQTQQPVLRYRSGTSADDVFTLQRMSDGRMHLLRCDGTNVCNLSIGLGREPVSGWLRLSYHWDADAGRSLLTAENLTAGTIRQQELRDAWPLRSEDIHRIFVSATGCHRHPSVSWMALADHLQPVGPAPGLAPTTRIGTPDGPRELESLKAGDLVMTKDAGAQPLLWRGAVLVPSVGAHRMVRLIAPYFGRDTDLVLQPGQRVAISGTEVEYLFGEEEVLVEARHLVNGETAHWEPEGSVVACHGLLLRQHCLVEADGCWIDSLYFGRIARNRDLARTTAPGSTLAEDQLPVHNRPARRELLDFEAQMLALARSRSRAPFAA
ncbi:MAG: Hint domain-containing protein [Rhodobacteraceae bacterium]|nr:Hint domain-containing protein [Paracoccaceae bacterium]